jgi:hypothetical protein
MPEPLPARHYPNAPITEAIIELRVELPPSNLCISLWTAVTAPLDGPKAFPSGTRSRGGPCAPYPPRKTYSPGSEGPLTQGRGKVRGKAAIRVAPYIGGLVS